MLSEHGGCVQGLGGRRGERSQLCLLGSWRGQNRFGLLQPRFPGKVFHFGKDLLNQYKWFRHPPHAKASYVYGVGDPSSPILELEPSEALSCLEWSRRQHGVLAGGSLNGTLHLWDTRAGGLAQATTDTERGECVTGLAWLGSKHGTEVLVSR